MPWRRRSGRTQPSIQWTVLPARACGSALTIAAIPLPSSTTRQSRSGSNSAVERQWTASTSGVGNQSSLSTSLTALTSSAMAARSAG